MFVNKFSVALVDGELVVTMEDEGVLVGSWTFTNPDDARKLAETILALLNYPEEVL